MKFPILARSAVALSRVGGPISAVGLALTLAAGAASLVNRLLNGRAVYCPKCEGPLVPGECHEGPCLTCPSCNDGCYDEDLRRVIVMAQDTPLRLKCDDCEAQLVPGKDAETGDWGLICPECDPEPAPEASAPTSSAALESPTPSEEPAPGLTAAAPEASAPAEDLPQALPAENA